MKERTLLHTFVMRARDDAEKVAVREFGGRSYTWSEWDREARAFAAALIDSGCTPGDVVAILAGNSMIWPIADVGALMAGCVSVGVYPTSPAVQVHEVLNDCAARVVVVDSAEQLAKVHQVRAGLPNLRLIIAATHAENHGVTEWPDWMQRGRNASARVAAELNDRILDASPADIAILIYTSGSTGTPKGARISHCYLSASAESIRAALDLTAEDSTVSFLPFCHAAERIFGLYSRIHTGMSATMIEDTAQLWAAARSAEPTLFGGLPRFYEKIFEALQEQRAALPAAAQSEWDRAEALGRERSRLLRCGQTVAPEMEQAWLAASAPARATIQAMIGSRVRIATSGGATLPQEVAETLAAFGLTVLGAYGLTEHLCVAMHRPHAYNFNSVGLPMDGTALRISESGEIQIKRGPLTFSGYQNNLADTAAAFTEDKLWLRTGDLGQVDTDGYLYVTGREKELIALSGGKKVAPVPIERKLTESAWISQAVLFGESRKYISALLVLRSGVVEQWARARGLPLDELVTAHPDLLAQIQAEIDRVNEQLSRPEQVRRFAILPQELSPERNELTATMKVRRDVVEQRYAPFIESLYR